MLTNPKRQEHKTKPVQFSAPYLFWKMHCRLLKLNHQLRRLKQSHPTTLLQAK